MTHNEAESRLRWQPRRFSLLVLLFFLFAYLLPLGARGLIVPDEARYAEIPREMIASGDWVVPHLDGVRYFEKPALGYWVHAGSLMLFGDNNFAIRFPSAVTVGLSALLLYFLVYGVSRDLDKESRLTAILTSLVFLSCFEVFAVGNTAVLDSLFSFFLTATVVTIYLASEAPPWSSREMVFLLLAGFSCGLAFLTKGFLALAVPVLAMAPYLSWQRRYTDLFRLSWMPLFIAVLVALPWSMMIQLREPDFWPFFFWNEHIRRFMADNAQHKATFWLYFITAPGLFLPWTFMVPAAVPGIKDTLKEPDPQGRLLRFSICWLVGPFLFFSVSRGKLLTYILPCFPPFAVLMAVGLSRSLACCKNRSFQWGSVSTGVFFGLLLLALIYVQSFGFRGFRPYGSLWKTLLAMSGLIFIIFMCFWAFRMQHGKEKFLLFGLAPILFFFTAHFIIPKLAIEQKEPGLFLKQYARKVSNDKIVITDDNTVRAVCWYFKRSDAFMLGGLGELAYGMAYKDAAGRAITMKTARDLIKKNKGKVALIARQKNITQWRKQLPKPFFQNNSGPKGFALWQF